MFGQKAIRALRKAGGARKGSADGTKRKPSAFNLFVKEKLEEMNREDVDKEIPYKEKFKRAVAKWTVLSDEQKKQYAAKYAHLMADAPAGAPSEPAAPTPAKRAAASSSDDDSSDEEEKQRKKKKKEKVRKR